MSLGDLRAYKRIGENRFREVRGLYYEDVTVGEIVEHRPGRTITAADNLSQSLLALNLNPIHTDAGNRTPMPSGAGCAAKAEWGRPLVSRLVTLSIVTGMSVNSPSALTFANL